MRTASPERLASMNSSSSSRTEATSALSAFWQARLVSSPASVACIQKTSATSPRVVGTTLNERLGDTSTNPSAARRSSASRTGMVLTPSWRASSSWVILASGVSSPVRIMSRRVSATSTASVLRRSERAAGTLVILSRPAAIRRRPAGGTLPTRP